MSAFAGQIRVCRTHYHPILLISYLYRELGSIRGDSTCSPGTQNPRKRNPGGKHPEFPRTFLPHPRPGKGPFPLLAKHSPATGLRRCPRPRSRWGEGREDAATAAGPAGGREAETGAGGGSLQRGAVGSAGEGGITKPGVGTPHRRPSPAQRSLHARVDVGGGGQAQAVPQATALVKGRGSGGSALMLHRDRLVAFPHAEAAAAGRGGEDGRSDTAQLPPLALRRAQRRTTPRPAPPRQTPPTGAPLSEERRRLPALWRERGAIFSAGKSAGRHFVGGRRRGLGRRGQ